MNCPSCSVALPPEAKFCPACRAAVISGTAGQAIDFSPYIQERTRDFTGREWAFRAIQDWLRKSSGPCFFLLTGEPGCGKTAVAGRLTQFSDAAVFPAPDLSSFSPGFLRGVHFCSSRDGSWIDPRIFSRCISLQLARSLPGFSQALVDTAEKSIQIQATMNVGTASENATVAGVLIHNLIVSGGNAQEVFNRTVVDPLQALFNRGFGEQVILLVDSLDESLYHRGEATIVGLLSRLKSLPPQVRFIVTSRRDPRVENEFREAECLCLSAPEFDLFNLADVEAYVAWKVAHDKLLAEKIARLRAGESSGWVKQVTERSEGNFLYVSFLLEAMARTQRPVDDMEALPAGLDGLYYDSLKRAVELGNKEWNGQYAPFLGVLSVAQESLLLEQVKSLSGLSEGMVWACLGDLQPFVETLAPTPEQTEQEDRYRFYHQSVIDFLHRPQIQVQKNKLHNLYYLAPEDWHRQMARFYLQKDLGPWGLRDEYGLRYTATHVAKAAQGSSQPEKHRLTEILVKLVHDPDYQDAHLKRLTDLASLQGDLNQALKSAAEDGHPSSIPLLIQAALGYVAFRRKQLHPAPIFALARAGQVEAAEQRLSLLFAEKEWEQAVLLTIAWLAVEKNPAESRRLRDRVFPSLPVFGPLPLLGARVNAELDGLPLPLLSLPAPPPPDVAQNMVRRLGGMGEGPTLTEYESPPALAEEVQPGSSSYEASLNLTGERTAPWLVSYAVADPAEGTDLVKNYQAILAQNNYVPYRNRFLWALLDAILKHPLQEWVRDVLTGLEAAALTGSKLDFQEALPITLLSLNVRSGKPAAAQELKDFLQKARDQAATLLPTRGKGDTWGSHKRRLTALAEALHAVLGRADEARHLFQDLLHLPYGFAGFEAPACLTLVEGMQVCRAPDPEIRCGLEGARRAAHNIQEFSFCARTTARVNAMQERWWSAEGFDAREVVPRFIHNPHSPEFAALHFVGEPYSYRAQGLESTPLPDWVRQANTLAWLAMTYRRSTEDLQRLNPGWASEFQLPPGTRVYIPDPEMGPLLAARFAAEVSAAESISSDRRVELIKSLVPAAVNNPTALDTVLARLLIAACPVEMAALEGMGELVKTLPPGVASPV